MAQLEKQRAAERAEEKAKRQRQLQARLGPREDAERRGVDRGDGHGAKGEPDSHRSVAYTALKADT